MEGGVADAVALEGGSVAVVCEAVQFDDEAVLGPEGVHLVVEEDGVEGRRG